MARKVAKDVLKSLDYFLQNRFEDYGERNHDAMMMAIQALEQEPCEDAISRQAVDTLIDELARAISDERCYLPQRGRDTGDIMQNILDLPPVTPQPKTGHWNTYELAQGGINEKWLECSECMWSNALLIPRNYCPKCGARMSESEG